MRAFYRSMLFVGSAAAAAALPLGALVSDEVFSPVSLSLSLGAGIAAALWLSALVAGGLADRLNGAVGALLGLLTFATVLGVFSFQPWGTDGPYNVGERFMFFALSLSMLCLYPVIVGGVLGLVFRRIPLSS